MTLDEHLRRIESADLIHPVRIEPELEYTFRHALIQQAIYSATLREDRRKLHGSVARALETLYPDRLGELAPQLALHFEQANDYSRALHYLTQAADQAAQGFANVEAIGFYSRAIQAAEHTDISSEALSHLYLGLGRAQEQEVRWEDARATYEGFEQAAANRGDDTLRLGALSAQAALYSLRTPLFDLERSSHIARQGLEIAAGRGDEQAEARLLWNLSLAEGMRGNGTEAIDYGERSLAIARRLNLRDQIAYSLNDLAKWYFQSGNLAAARAAFSETRQLWRALNRQDMLSDTLLGMGGMYLTSGDYDSLLTVMEELAQISQEIHSLFGSAMALSLLSLALGIRNQISQHIASSRESIRLARLIAHAQNQITSLQGLGMTYAYLGDYETARSLVDEALARAEQDMPQHASFAVLYQAALAAAQGDRDAVEAAVKRSGEAIIPPAFSRFLLPPMQAGILTFLNDYTGVIQKVDAALARFPASMQRMVFLCQAQTFKGQALAKLGRTDEARNLLSQVHATLSETGARYWRWETLAALADIEEGMGEMDSALRHRAEAKAEIEFLIGQINDAALEGSFRARPDVAAVLG